MECEIKSDMINNESVLKAHSNLLKESTKCNFRKIVLQLAKGKVELGISFYSDALLVIISSNGKLGNFWISDNEEENDALEENDYEARCILGNRKDEVSQFFSHAIINFIFHEIKNKEQSLYNNIKKVLISFTLKYDELFNIDLQNPQELLLTTEFKQFFENVKKNISKILLE